MSLNIDDDEQNQETLYEEFFTFFKDKKDHLTIKETKNAMRCFGLLITESELMEMMNIPIQTPKERIRVSLDQFISCCKVKQGKINIDLLHDAFKSFDIHNTGFINAQILKHSISVFKPNSKEDDIEQILSEFDTDENGNINYSEYIDKLLNAK